jgi:hypothetical protein
VSERKRRLQKLLDAREVLRVLADEMPQAAVLIRQASRQLNSVREAYEEQCKTLDELAGSRRKPPMRVSMSKRRPKIELSPPMQPIRKTPLPESVLPRNPGAPDPRDYDHEAEQELADRFGHDIPDGSD